MALPSAAQRWEELDGYLDGMKEELLADVKAERMGERFAMLEGGAKGQPPQIEGAAEGGDGTGNAQDGVLRPGSESELIKPVDVELEEMWKVRSLGITGAVGWWQSNVTHCGLCQVRQSSVTPSSSVAERVTLLWNPILCHRSMQGMEMYHKH